jgi:hypothetical protein
MQIFMSYASEHREIADQVRQGLLNNGHEVFFDRDALPSAGNYHRRIAEAIARSDLMVFLVARRSVARGTYALTELKLARVRWPSPVGRVLPVMVEAVPLELIPAYLKSVTLLEPDGDLVAETVAAVAQMDRDRGAADLSAPRPTAQQLLAQAGLSVVALVSRGGIALGLALAATVGALVYAPQLAAGARDAAGMLRVSSAGASIPLNTDVRQALQGTVGRLAAVVQRDALAYESRQTTPWALAQAMLALSEAERLAPEVYTTFVRSAADPACACWTEFLDKPGDKCVFISGWILAAMALQSIAATSEEVNYLLRQQGSDGWWAMFPDPVGTEFASPYATAWALMGLHLQRSLPRFPSEQRELVSKAIAKGKAWLLSVRERDAARWKRYPASLKSEVSVSVSGTVMHALHVVESAELGPIDALWLDSLPTGIAGEAENPYVIVETRSGQATDYWEQIKLPWVLVATVDAYPEGGLRQRARALRWIEATLADPRVLATDTEHRAWWRAEYLYGLRYALRPAADTTPR